jgi:hypothetical protein
MTQQMMTTPAPTYLTNSSSVSETRTMELGSLARRALIESRRFYRHEEYDSSFAYELFRRALVECDDAAWGHIFEQYTPLVEHWVRRTGAFTVSGESSDFFVSAAFTRFWKAIPAARFSAFPSLASLLNYLRSCATCVVIDTARAQSYAELLPEECINWNDQRLGHVDEEATELVCREEFWGLVDGLLTSQAERVLIRCSFMLGMKPGDIYASHGELFHGVEEVYTLKRAVLTRLRKSPELRGLY